jgi:hypothetical protein
LPDLVSFRTNPERYLLVRDQALDGDTVTVDLVVSDIPLWVVIYSDADGVPDAILGESWVPAGVSRAIAVPIDLNRVTPTLHAVLHLDRGTPERFDFPGGEDVAMVRNLQVVESPFSTIIGD